MERDEGEKAGQRWKEYQIDGVDSSVSMKDANEGKMSQNAAIPVIIREERKERKEKISRIRSKSEVQRRQCLEGDNNMQRPPEMDERNWEHQGNYSTDSDVTLIEGRSPSHRRSRHVDEMRWEGNEWTTHSDSESL